MESGGNECRCADGRLPKSNVGAVHHSLPRFSQLSRPGSLGRHPRPWPNLSARAADSSNGRLWSSNFFLLTDERGNPALLPSQYPMSALAQRALPPEYLARTYCLSQHELVPGWAVGTPAARRSQSYRPEGGTGRARLGNREGDRVRRSRYGTDPMLSTPIGTCQVESWCPSGVCLKSRYCKPPRVGRDLVAPAASHQRGGKTCTRRCRMALVPAVLAHHVRPMYSRLGPAVQTGSPAQRRITERAANCALAR